MRPVINLDHDGLGMSDRWAVNVAFWIAVETAGGQRDARRGVFIFAFETEHELVRGMDNEAAEFRLLRQI